MTRSSPLPFLVVALLFMPGSCGAKGAMEKAIDAIDGGINNILNDSTSWRTTLQRVAEELPSELSEIIRTDAQSLATRTIAQGATTIQCSVDFLSDRAVAALRQLRARLLGETPPLLPPAFCFVVPSSIDLKVDPASWSNLTLHGYDLDHKDSDGNLLQFFTVDSNGTRQQISESRVGRTTHYQITLNLGSMAQGLHTGNIRKIVSSWKGNIGNLPEVVVLPWEPSTTTDNVSISETHHMPPKVGRGDRDFSTDDDEHMSIDVRGALQIGETQIESRVFMHAKEERSDWTEVSGWSDWASIYTAPAGWKIREVRPRSSSSHIANITTHGDKTYNRPAGEVISRFVVRGDRGGDEAGTWTSVRATWRPLQVTLEEVVPEWLR